MFITYIYFIFLSRLKNVHYIFNVRRDHNPNKSFYTTHIFFYCAFPPPPTKTTFLFCFWLRKKSRKEVYSSAPPSANFQSVSSALHTLHSAHQNSIWTVILNALLFQTSFWTQIIEHYIQFWGRFYSHEISFSKFRNEAFLVWILHSDDFQRLETHSYYSMSGPKNPSFTAHFSLATI